jgi:hypothetical protein
VRVVAALRAGNRPRGESFLAASAGDIAGAAEDRDFLLEHAYRVRDPQRLIPSLAATALSHVLLGKHDDARAVAEETIELVRANIDMTGAANFLVFVAGQLGIRDEFGELVELAPMARGKT